jgi:hypothetical protein
MSVKLGHRTWDMMLAMKLDNPDRLVWTGWPDRSVWTGQAGKDIETGHQDMTTRIGLTGQVSCGQEQ